MGLRAVKPTQVKKRLKAFFYGAAGVGKTTAAIQFPKPYLIDTEKGSTNDQYVNLLNKSGGVVFHTSDFEEILNEVKLLLSEKHDYKTVIIDPLTVVYKDLLDKCEAKVKSDFGRHYALANKRMDHLINLLYRLDMNVILVSHQKNEYGKDMSILGSTFDCYKKLDYMFDLVIEIQKRGKERVGVIKKSRIESFPDGDIFPFSYSEISNRYGGDILEKECVSEILATKEQVEHLKYLVDLYKEPEETIEKWLKKANAESFEELNQDVISKLIHHMENKFKLKGAA